MRSDAQKLLTRGLSIIWNKMGRWWYSNKDAGWFGWAIFNKRDLGKGLQITDSTTLRWTLSKIQKSTNMNRKAKIALIVKGSRNRTYIFIELLLTWFSITTTHFIHWYIKLYLWSYAMLCAGCCYLSDRFFSKPFIVHVYCFITDQMKTTLGIEDLRETRQ